MMNKTHTLAFLLTVHNRKEKTLTCLRQINNLSGIENFKIDIYMTDDGCTDGTQSAVKIEFPAVNIIPGDGTLFWNRGMFAAWEEAEKNDYDFYLWLNDDTTLFNDALQRLMEESVRHNNSAIIVGSTVSSTDDKLVTYGGRNSKYKLMTDIMGVQECCTFNGNVVLIPRRVYKTVGKNDPVFLHGLGDFDYGLRAGALGIKNIVAKGTFGICDLHLAKPKWCDSQIPLADRLSNFFHPLGANPYNYFIFKKRHYGFIKACAVFCSNFLHVLFPSLWK